MFIQRLNTLGVAYMVSRSVAIITLILVSGIPL
jgi:hypothetical protein